MRTCWKIRGIAPWASYLAIAVVALFCTLFVASVAASPAHTHAQTNCSLCIAGGLPVEAPSPGIVSHPPPDRPECLSRGRSPFHKSEPPYAFTFGREPPA